MKIKPTKVEESWRTGTLYPITKAEITKALGMAPNNPPSSDGKAKSHWTFAYDNEMDEIGTGAIWDYKGSEKEKTFSTFGDSKMFWQIFGDKYIDDTHV